MVYDEGDVARLTAVFRNASGSVADPTLVTVEVRNSGQAGTTYTYGVDAALVKDSTGCYHLDFEISKAGLYFYRWGGTGAIVVAGESQFYVKRRQT